MKQNEINDKLPTRKKSAEEREKIRRKILAERKEAFNVLAKY